MAKKAPPAKSKKPAPPFVASTRGDKSIGQKSRQRSRSEKLGKYMTGG